MPRNFDHNWLLKSNEVFYLDLSLTEPNQNSYVSLITLWITRTVSHYAHTRPFIDESSLEATARIEGSVNRMNQAPKSLLRVASIDDDCTLSSNHYRSWITATERSYHSLAERF